MRHAQQIASRAIGREIVPSNSDVLFEAKEWRRQKATEVDADGRRFRAYVASGLTVGAALSHHERPIRTHVHYLGGVMMGGGDRSSAPSALMAPHPSGTPETRAGRDEAAYYLGALIHTEHEEHLTAAGAAARPTAGRRAGHRRTGAAFRRAGDARSWLGHLRSAPTHRERDGLPRAGRRDRPPTRGLPAQAGGRVACARAPGAGVAGNRTGRAGTLVSFAPGAAPRHAGRARS